MFSDVLQKKCSFVLALSKDNPIQIKLILNYYYLNINN